MRGKRTFVVVILVSLLALAAFALWRWQTARDTPAPGLRDPARIEAAMRPPTPPFVATKSLKAGGCPSPPAIATPELPAQTAIEPSMPAFTHPGGKLQPLAGFSVDARVLSTHRYDQDREAEFAPIDFALGWHRMRDDDVVQAFDIAQQNRWYYLRWDATPAIDIEQARRESANMHLIPANRDIATALAQVRPGQRVRLDGWLVEVHARDGWRWRSSLSRDDHGPGGCEVVYVCGVSKEERSQ